MKDESGKNSGSSLIPHPSSFRIGCVSYLNAKPLIFGLESEPDIELVLDVPSRLLNGLLASRFDVALLPTIDYQRMDNLALLPVGGIGSEDQTLTVCIFSKVPINQIRSLSCDPDSHTSVALARIILEESFHIHPEFVSSDNADARLLIGDKVITGPMQNAECRMQNESHASAFSPSSGTPGQGRGEGIESGTRDKAARDKGNTPHPNPPPEYQGRERNFFASEYQHHLDLGSAWKKLTGLPFLFACWTTRREAALGDLPQRLLAARQRGLANIPTILQRDALPLGWPVDIARQYLTQNLCYEVGQRQIDSLRLFHQKAATHGLIPLARPLEIFDQ